MPSITDRSLRMHNPPHPGEILKELYLLPLGLTVTDAAAAIGVSRTALSTVANGRARVSVDMAARLAKAFRTSVEFWLRLQLAHDVWQLERSKARVHVRTLVKKRAVNA